MYWLRVLAICIVVVISCFGSEEDQKNDNKKMEVYTLLAILILFQIVYIKYHPVVGLLNVFALVSAVVIACVEGSRSQKNNCDKFLSDRGEVLFLLALGIYLITTVIIIIEIIVGHQI